MRNKIHIRKADWQTTEEGWQTEFACPVVYRDDKPWIEYRCDGPCDFFLNGEFMKSSVRGRGFLRLSGQMRPGRNCLEIRGESLPEISLLITPKTHFRVPEDGIPTLSCSCSWAPGSGIMKVDADLMEIREGDILRLWLKDPEGKVLDCVEVPASRTEPVDLITDRKILWNGISDPARLEVVAQLIRNGRVKDEIRLFSGMRTIALKPGSGILLNGHPCPVRGRILQPGDDPEDLVRSGYTAVWDRSCTPDPWLLEECDRLGLVVFSDLTDSPLQIEAADGYVSLCFWVRTEKAPEIGDLTRLTLDPGLLQTDGTEFTI